MQQNQLHLFFILLISLNSIQSGDYDTMFICRRKHYEALDLSENQVNSEIQSALNSINLHYIDAYVFVLIGPIAIFSAMFIIITYIKYPEMREPPGDIFFALSVSEIILAMHWITSSERFFYNHLEAPINDEIFCQINGYISEFFFILNMLYNFAFCAYMIVQIRPTLKKKIKQIIYHIVCIAIATLLTTLLGVYHRIGKSIFGTCAMLATSKIALFERFYEDRKKFLNYYCPFIEATIGINTLFFLSYTISMINCYYWFKTNLTIFLTIGNISRLGNIVILSIIRFQDPFIIGQFQKLLRQGLQLDQFEDKSQNSFRTLSANSNFSKIIEEDYENENLNESELNGNMTSQLVNTTGERNNQEQSRNFFQLKREQRVESQPTNQMKIKHRQNTQYEIGNSIQEPLLNKTNSLSQSQQLQHSQSKLRVRKNTSSIDHDEGNFFEKIAINLKMNQIFVMLACILYHSKKIQEEIDSQFIINDGDDNNISNSSILNKEDATTILPELSSTELKRTSCYEFTKKTCIKQTPFSQLQKLNFNLDDVNVQVLAPYAFNELRLNERTGVISLEQTLNLIFNELQVKKAAQSKLGDGGKSGEFFFFSYDSKLIIKTLNNEDLNTFKEIIPDYYNHFRQNPNSLIAKVLGIFIFEYKEGEKVSVMLMKNLLQGFPSSCIERVYDLKGSTYSRQVLKNYNNLGQFYSKTLKDLDFNILEQNISIDKSKQKELIEIARKDSELFTKHKIMDYSLIVFKLNKTKYFEELTSDNNWREKQISVSPELLDEHSTFFSVIKSIQNPNIYYHIGIIDYLQKYNLQKGLEKYYRKFSNFNPQLDTSSQPPQIYAKRFVEYMEQIIKSKNQEIN